MSINVRYLEFFTQLQLEQAETEFGEICLYRIAFWNRTGRDYLGNLWRKNLVERLVAPEKQHGNLRWLYRWKGDRALSPDAIVYTPRVIADRPSMLITEEANVMTIEMPHLLISIQAKAKSVELFGGDQERLTSCETGSFASNVQLKWWLNESLHLEAAD